MLNPPQTVPTESKATAKLNGTIGVKRQTRIAPICRKRNIRTLSQSSYSGACKIA